MPAETKERTQLILKGVRATQLHPECKVVYTGGELGEEKIEITMSSDLMNTFPHVGYGAYQDKTWRVKYHPMTGSTTGRLELEER